MKSILYAGAVLMAGACIYGFTEYRNSSQNEGFKEMYTEEKPVKAANLPAVTEKQETVATVPAKSKSELFRKKTVRVVEDVKETKSLSRPERMESTETAKIEKADVDLAPSEKLVVKKKKKRVNSKMFSRAPIREEQEDLILVPEAKKEQVKDTKVSKTL